MNGAGSRGRATTGSSPGRGLYALVAVAVMLAAALSGSACAGAGDDSGGQKAASSPAAVVAGSPAVATASVALFPAKVGARYGFIDASGAMVIKPRFKEAFGFSDGLAAVQVDDRWGFIDPSGTMLIEPRFSDVWEFSGGLAAVSLDYEKYGYVDKTGAMVVEPRFAEAGSFSQGRAPVSLDGDEYGFIDASGTMVIEPRFGDAWGFSEGLAGVAGDDGLGFVDASGTVVVQPRYGTDIPEVGFSEGLAAVSDDGGWGFIDTSGTVVIKPRFKYAGSFSEGRAPVQGFVRGPARGRWGFVDAGGSLVIDMRFGQASVFSEGLAAVMVHGRWGYVDKSGTIAIDPQFSYAEDFSHGLAAVEMNGESGYIDKTGRIVWPAPKPEVPLPAAIAATRLAFVRGGNIWTIAADGSDPRQLTSGGALDNLPAWAPDGKTIAFVRSADVGETAAICLVPANGGTVRLLLRDTTPGADYSFVGGLAFAPDGRQLAYSDTYGSTSSNAQHSRVVSIDLTSGEPTVLLKRAYGFGAIDASWGLSWSPDGTTLLISQAGLDAEGGQTRLFGLNDGSLRKLPIADASDAAWSPDGASILVSPFNQSRSRILIARSDGRVLRTLARGGGWEGAPSVAEARFSPDGAWIAYTRSGSGVWLMRADGSGKHGLTNGSLPAWP